SADVARRIESGVRPGPLPRLPPAWGEEAWGALGRAARLAVAGRRVRVAAAVARDLAIVRGGRSGGRGGCVPRADEAVRGGRARDGRRARGSVWCAAEGRDH